MKRFRFTIYVAGQEMVGKWRPYDLQAVLRDCETFAANDTAFTVEFERPPRQRPLLGPAFDKAVEE